MDRENFYQQVQALRERAAADPHGAGLESLRLMEDLFFEEARARGFRNRHGGLGEYTNFLKARRYLSEEQHARAQRYADVRNCVSHRSGLLVSAPLAFEIFDFLEMLVKGEALNAAHLMTRNPKTIAPTESLLRARDWMLRKGISQLPVVEGERVVGLLTNRDLLLVEAAQRTQPPESTERLRVADAMSADAQERITFVTPATAYDEVLDALRRDFTALLVTARGNAEGPLLGIITINDLLPKL